MPARRRTTTEWYYAFEATPVDQGKLRLILAGVAPFALAALVPKPRANLTGFHGVFAPNSKHRIQVTPGNRAKYPVGVF